jgi:5-methylcytosine-specific restriction enzyme B
MAAVEPDGGQPQREALLHLLFPDVFEPIVSVTVKRRIVEAYADCVEGDPTDVDRALLAIRAHLAGEHGSAFSWGQPPLDAVWRAQRPTA